MVVLEMALRAFSRTVKKYRSRATARGPRPFRAGQAINRQFLSKHGSLPRPLREGFSLRSNSIGELVPLTAGIWSHAHDDGHVLIAFEKYMYFDIAVLIYNYHFYATN